MNIRADDSLKLEEESIKRCTASLAGWKTRDCAMRYLFMCSTQFYRNYPGPPDVTAAELELLVRKYQDPENEGLVNYMNLHNDLLAVRDENAPITASEAVRLGARLGLLLAGSDGARALSVDEQKQLYTNLVCAVCCLSGARLSNATE